MCATNVPFSSLRQQAQTMRDWQRMVLMISMCVLFMYALFSPLTYACIIVKFIMHAFDS